METRTWTPSNQRSRTSNRNSWFQNGSAFFQNSPFSLSYPFVKTQFRNSWGNSSPQMQRHSNSPSNEGTPLRMNGQQNQQFNGQRFWRWRNPNWKHRKRFDRRYILTEDITRLFAEKGQSDYVNSRKLKLRRLILDELQRYYDVNVVIVGSSANGLATMYSELDICVIFRTNVIDTIHALDSIGAILSRKDFVKNKRLILAKVPILKFIDSVSGTVVNINVNNRTCIRNTILIKTYTRLDERVAPLIVAVKIWARQNGINDASNKTMNGYTLTLMAINFLQSKCSPAVLPCLHKLMPEEFDNNLDTNSDRNWMNLYLHLPNFRSQNTDSIGELFLQFLHYYGFEFDFQMNVVSVRAGSMVAKSEYIDSNKNEISQWRFICVEEPFDLTNTGRSVSDKIASDYIVDVFKCSYRVVNVTQSLFTIF